MKQDGASSEASAEIAGLEGALNARHDEIQRCRIDITKAARIARGDNQAIRDREALIEQKSVQLKNKLDTLPAVHKIQVSLKSLAEEEAGIKKRLLKSEDSSIPRGDN